MDDSEIAALVGDAVGRPADGAVIEPLLGRQGLLVCRVRLGANNSYVFKAVRETARRELEVAVAVSKIAPDCAPRVIAHEADTKRGLYWLVSEDVGSITLAERPTVKAYVEAAKTLARLQRAAVGEEALFTDLQVRLVQQRDWEEIGLQTLELANSQNVSRSLLAVDEIERVVWAIDDLARDASTIPSSLVHGDLHAGNLAVLPGDPPSIKLMDWGTAYFGPAFLGLEELLWPAARHLSRADALQQVRTAYVRVWGDLLGKAGRLEGPLLATRSLVRLHVFVQALRDARPAIADDLFQPAAVLRKLLDAFRDWERRR